MPFIALTGTPGTGKSRLRRLLPAKFNSVEVGELAMKIGSGRQTKRNGIVVDLAKTGRWMRSHRDRRPQILVGHLAHLLPVRDAIVLRCHPVQLEKRLASARKGGRRSREENALAEALGVITSEAIALGRNVFETDTTRKSPSRVAREIAAWLDGPRRPRVGKVDWLRDGNVTKHLLKWTR